MKRYKFKGQINGKSAYLCRIDKRKARALFDTGATVYLVPSNFAPFGAWIQPLPIKKDNPYTWQPADFDTVTNEFKYYNCINSETGFFPAYYFDLLSNESLPKVKL